MRMFTKQLKMYGNRSTRVIVIMGHGKSGKTHRLLRFLKTGGCVTVDEAQFCGIDELIALACSKVRKVPLVLCGLEYWASGAETPLKLLARSLMDSTKIESHIYRLDRGKCRYCGGQAEIDIKTEGEPGKLIDVSKSMYVPGCRICWKKYSK